MKTASWLATCERIPAQYKCSFDCTRESVDPLTSRAEGRSRRAKLSERDFLLGSHDQVHEGHSIVGDPRIWWRDVFVELAGIQIEMNAQHIKSVYSLPAIHKDPFDRVLIAQATAEDLTLVTTDAKLSQYALEPSLNLQVIH